MASVKAVTLQIIIASLLIGYFTALPVKKKAVKVSRHPIVVVVSYDGFWYDYLKKGNTPTLDSLMENGVHVPYMQPVFPTMTFPNHQSIATGLHSESHGIVANEVFDPLFNETYSGFDDDPGFWNYHDDVLPIWLYNERAGEGRVSASILWPGASQPYGKANSSLPTHYIPGNDYEGIIPWEFRVDTLISWITDEEKPANLIFLYYNEPDSAGHSFGPGSSEVREEIVDIDNRTAYLVDKLKEAGLFEMINFIFLSDHGMVGVAEERMINITRMTDNSLVNRRFGSTPSFHYMAKEGKVDELYEHFLNLSLHHNFTVWKKGQREHYSNNRRIMDVTVLADPGYAFDDFIESADFENAKWKLEVDFKREYGVHGYSHLDDGMQPFFIAHGPAFRSGFNHSNVIHNVDIVPLVSKILGFPEPPNNGSLARVIDMLNPDFIASRKSHN